MKKDIKGLDNLKKNVLILLLCWLVGIGILVCAYLSSKHSDVSKEIKGNGNSQMNMYVIDTKGDSVLLESGGNFILMDTGYKDENNTVVKFVNKKIASSKRRGEFKSFSVYITELNGGFIGELNDVFNEFKVDSLYIQEKGIITAAFENTENYSKLLKKYNSIISLANKDSADIVTLNRGTEIVFGDAKITVLGPLEDIKFSDYENDSNKLEKYIDDTSLVSIVTVGETRYLTTGNISKKMEEKLFNEYENNLNAEIYKLNNYGNNKSNSGEFLKYIAPDYTIKTYKEKSKTYLTNAVDRAMYYGAAYSTQFNENISINILNDDIYIYPDNNYTKLNIYYETDNSIELSNKTYNISKGNTLTEKWDFFSKEFIGYELIDIQYGKSLSKITSNLYNGETFKGIKDINNSLDIVVVYKEIEPEAINLNSSVVKLDVGDEVEINASLEPVNAKESKLIWKSEDEKIASVKDGKITGESIGKTTITVTVKNTSIKASCEVVVGDYDPTIDGINLKMKSLTIDKNTSFNLNDYIENNNISWSVSNPDVLTIDSESNIKPLKTGVTIITASLNGYTDRCKVTVTDGLVLANIKPLTTVGDLSKKLQLDNIKVIGSYGKSKADSEIVATGDSLISVDGYKATLYLISIIGDVNGEGQINDDDIKVLSMYLKDNKKLSKASLKAADVNNDGKITEKDLKILTNYVKHKKGYDKLPYNK